MEGIKIEGMREIKGREVERLEQKPAFEIIQEDKALQEALLGTEGFVVGLKVIPFNAKMRAARKAKKGLTQARLGKLVGVAAPRISQIETFRHYPNPELAQKIAEALEVSAEELFPEWLRFYLREARSIIALKEFTSEQIEELQASRCLLPATIDPERVMDKSLLREIGEETLATLDPDERDILRRYLGFDGNPEGFGRIAKSYPFGPSRASQIYNEALRKLRHPARSRKLRDFF